MSKSKCGKRVRILTIIQCCSCCFFLSFICESKAKRYRTMIQSYSITQLKPTAMQSSIIGCSISYDSYTCILSLHVAILSYFVCNMNNIASIELYNNVHACARMRHTSKIHLSTRLKCISALYICK